MAVFHVLKNGTKVADITGHIVRVEDAAAVYDLIHKINSGQKYAKEEPCKHQ